MRSRVPLVTFAAVQEDAASLLRSAEQDFSALKGRRSLYLAPLVPMVRMRTL
jgi:hypothetical protein